MTSIRWITTEMLHKCLDNSRGKQKTRRHLHTEMEENEISHDLLNNLVQSHVEPHLCPEGHLHLTRHLHVCSSFGHWKHCKLRDQSACIREEKSCILKIFSLKCVIWYLLQFDRLCTIRRKNRASDQNWTFCFLCMPWHINATFLCDSKSGGDFINACTRINTYVNEHCTEKILMFSYSCYWFYTDFTFSNT